MARLLERQDYDYRQDPDVPRFDDSGPVALMDGHCALCSWGARTIVRLDREERFRFCPVQSATGTALATHFGLDPDDPDTWLFLHDGRAWSGMEATIRICETVGGVARIASVMRIFPRPLREWLYRRIARNRYRLGRTDICAIPDERLRRRLIS